MKNRQRYPSDWKAIALRIKQAANWTCRICGLRCYDDKGVLAGVWVSKGDRQNKSFRARHTLTVHHVDLKPENNEDENLIALCSGCHLRQHAHGRGNVPVGQMEIDFHQWDMERIKDAE